MKVPRNAPCPCGSGRKFKNCHGRAGRENPPPPEAVWRKVRRLLDGLPQKMFEFIEQTYGRRAIDEAWGEFTLQEDETRRFDPETPHLQAFLPWFFYRWRPISGESGVGDASLHGRVPGRVLLEREGRWFDPLLRRYVEACLATPFSFYELMSVESGTGFRARDVFTGGELDVLERSASRSMRAGQILYGQLVTVDGATLMEACGPFPFPRRMKLDLIDLRKDMHLESSPVTAETLDDWEVELRSMYLDAVDEAMNPPPLRLQNTDGEDLAYHRLLFEIESPRRAFDALKDLSSGLTGDELLEDADLGPGGELERISFAWTVPGNPVHPTWEDTVHGHIEIEGRELRAEVNSAERAARLQSLVEERVGDARLVRRDVSTADEILAKVRAKGGRDAEPEPRPPLPPEVVEAVRRMHEAHHETWVTTEIPALGGLTPLEAVETPAGRDKVEVLLAEIEERGRTMNPPLAPESIRRLRERLGLSPEPGGR